MRSSKITPDLLGPFHTAESPLQPGMYQSMVFSESDAGPCYLSDTQRVNQRFDRVTNQTLERELRISELVSRLKASGKVDNPVGNDKEKLQKLAQKHGLPIKCTETKNLPGWVNKPKGALQVLFERGWINPSRIHDYTEKGKKTQESSVNTNVNPSNTPSNTDITGCNFSIKELMRRQRDFVEEITLMQYYGNKMGVVVDRTPKCHPELAGEGIEYAWAIAKLFYRKSPIALKRSKSLFQQLVRDSTDTNNVLTLDKIQACSRKARTYMKMYVALESIGMDDENFKANKHSVMEGAMKFYSKIKKMTKKSKAHRSVLDMNLGDVREIENLDIGNNSSLKQSNNMKVEKKQMIGILLKKMMSI